MSEEAKQHETTEVNDVVQADGSSSHQGEPNSAEYEELPIDNSDESLMDVLEELSTDDDSAAEANDGESPVQGEDQPGQVANGVDSDALTQLAAEVETLKSHLDERTSQYTRIAADFENFRRRTSREKSDLEQRAKRDTLSELLPIIDSFDRARSHIKPQTDEEDNIHNSYQGVYKQLVDCLKRIGVAPMRSKGQPFDPNLHEAVMREPTNEFEEGMVMEELVSGYLIGEQVLRHAMVKVAAPSEEGDQKIDEGDAEIADSTVTEES